MWFGRDLTEIRHGTACSTDEHRLSPSQDPFSDGQLSPPQSCPEGDPALSQDRRSTYTHSLVEQESSKSASIPDTGGSGSHALPQQNRNESQHSAHAAQSYDRFNDSAPSTSGQEPYVTSNHVSRVSVHGHIVYGGHQEC